jgi:hypothetical protein
VNDSAQIPGHLRIDLSLDVPSVDSLPTLISDIDTDSIKCNTAEGKAIYDSIRAIVDAKITAKLSNKPTKALSSLMTSTPHRHFLSSDVAYDLSTIPGLSPTEVQDLEFDETRPNPVSYLSLDALDDFLAGVDTSLSIPVAPTLNPTVPLSHFSDKELQVRNPNSVYNWLRRHEPKIFLQDAEGSEKSSGKPGALRGAGKRTSIPAPAKPDTMEFVEEDGIGYDASLGGAVGGTLKGKRKRPSDEDAGYRPKGGASRPYKKKKKDSLGEGSSSRRSSKSKVKAEVDTETEDMGDVAGAE